MPNAPCPIIKNPLNACRTGCLRGSNVAAKSELLFSKQLSGYFFNKV
ncbi:hypothetical protein H6G33_18655 [Calothrix sp. FACHB-1219]|nr:MULTISPECIES: hypothetical protein [unclassified Calothrix]MBD2203453.1 hypothetical protein [Calothrix sp. FACHB-168]MBD2219045.1 hypothetical protein [Calothrix sp. FACHB-1219]